jgi:hypothetical protein
VPSRKLEPRERLRGDKVFALSTRGTRLNLESSDLSQRSKKSYYYSSNSPTLYLKGGEYKRAQEVLSRFPGLVRTGYGSSSVHADQRRETTSLPTSAWPRDSRGKGQWPSTPNFNEILEMSRRGEAPQKRQLSGHFVSLSRSEFSNSSELVTRVVSKQIIGIRADVKVPPKYLEHFRYRWNFLILTSTCIPIGLSRFLIAKWCTDPFSLWLERKESLKSYLRKVPVSIINRAVQALRARLEQDEYAWSGGSHSASEDESGSEPDFNYSSDDSESDSE